MHYDSSTLGYAAAYVGTLGLLGIPTALLTARALTREKLTSADARALE
jgi:hypothetical protein